MSFLISVVAGFILFAAGTQLALGLARFFSIYTTVHEREAKVFTLFGEVIGTIDQPGLHFLWKVFGPRAVLLPLFGKTYSVDLRIDQEYLRSQPVNSEEGAPMGIGVWYEMALVDPVAFLFKNTDPKGSLRANVSNATVRTLSNMRLGDMLETRHVMSRLVRQEVGPRSKEWGYELGSVYIRKVHFRDTAMIRQIEEKIVNRLRQVTSAIRQDGTNQVNIIKSTADRTSASEFAKASAKRPNIVGEALQQVSADPEVMEAMFDILETQKLIAAQTPITLLPKREAGLMAPLLATKALPPG